MSTSKFTPGPWTFDKADPGQDWEFDILGREPDDPEENEHILAGVFYTASLSIRGFLNDGLANARLIAAAPEMYALLVRIGAFLERVNASDSGVKLNLLMLGWLDDIRVLLRRIDGEAGEGGDA